MKQVHFGGGHGILRPATWFASTGIDAFYFRRTALGLTAAGMGAAGFSHSAIAQEGTGSPACASIKDATAGAKCEISESIRRTNAHIQRGNEAERRGLEAERIGNAAEKQSECSGNLTSWARGNNSRIEAVRIARRAFLANVRSIALIGWNLWDREDAVTPDPRSIPFAVPLSSFLPLRMKPFGLGVFRYA